MPLYLAMFGFGCSFFLGNIYSNVVQEIFAFIGCDSGTASTQCLAKAELLAASDGKGLERKAGKSCKHHL